MSLYCPACEAPSAVRTDLGYIGHDGTLGHVAGVSCAACGYIAEDPGATYVPDAGRVDLHGLTVLEWFTFGLRALGCDPRPHR